MKNLRTARRSSQRGQGMTEYIIITALIGIAAIAAFTAFSDTVQSQVATMSEELGGKDSSGSARQDVDNAMTAAKAAAGNSQGLGDYASDAVHKP